VHQRLTGHPGLLVHGQLFHPTRLEFAGGRSHFVGYEEGGIPLRDHAPMAFLTDVIRAERERMSGFLLRWNQGGQIPETLMSRADVRIVILRGDPLIAFAEDVLGPTPRLEQVVDPEALDHVPPDVAAHRFREFLKTYQLYVVWLARQATAAGSVKPKTWIVRLNFANQGRDWSKRLESCLGIGLADTAADVLLSGELAAFERRRARVSALLIAGGIDPVVLETLDREADNPAIALALV
jgi:hypothetical protein